MVGGVKASVSPSQSGTGVGQWREGAGGGNLLGWEASLAGPSACIAGHSHCLSPYLWHQACSCLPTGKNGEDGGTFNHGIELVHIERLLFCSCRSSIWILCW